MAAIVWSDLTDHFNESSLTAVKIAAQTTILAFVNSTNGLDPSLFDDEDGPLTKLARLYLAAHLGTLAKITSGISGAVGPVIAEEGGRLKRQYATLVTGAALKTSAYGVVFDELLQQSGARSWIAL
jgi:hypothetical protein